MIHGGDIKSYLDRYGKNPVDFSANISPLPMPTAIKEAMVLSLEEVGNYPDPLCRDLRRAISDGSGILEKYILAGNGASDLIYRLMYSLRPKKAVILAPTFAEYEQALQAVGCHITYYQLQEENQFEVGVDILDSIDDDTDIVVVCQPNNPTGKTCQNSILNSILKKCEQVNAVFMIDECFTDFLKDEQDFSMVDFVAENKNLFILKAFTKMYGLAGVRLGYCYCSNVDLLEKMSRAGQPWGVSTVAQRAGKVAVYQTEYVKEVVCLIEEQRLYLTNKLKQLGFTVFEGSVNYILFKTDLLQLDVQLAERGFMIRDCSNYIGLSKGYFRIAVKNYCDNKGLIETLEDILK